MESKFQCEKCGKEYALQEAVVCCDKCFPEWQPIETAPKDGTRVLLFSGAWFTGYYAHSRYKWDPGKWRSDEYPDLTNPTHWMPLPQAPEK